ncbi:uncharacterized protein VP01_522g7 [Puccinia sorghi]|uniref:Uncharacterized protein n=1 Tax=Puccinia sorghi TaxID=27349 RepID=A0A0L6UMK3_9BASI|nr:uncharacterized protein VP01_522g7 [Puccinia sorghi]
MTVAKFTHLAIFSRKPNVVHEPLISSSSLVLLRSLPVASSPLIARETKFNDLFPPNLPTTQKLLDLDLYSPLVTRIKYLFIITIFISEQGQNHPDDDVATCFLAVLFSTTYMIGLSVAPDHLLFSVASHLVWLGVTIVLFVSGAAALTSEINGQDFPHQQRLETLQGFFFPITSDIFFAGFAWADSILLGFAMLFVLAIGVGRRNGLSGNLLGGP